MARRRARPKPILDEDIDERGFKEWAEYGMSQLNDYMKKQAKFAAYCEKKRRAATLSDRSKRGWATRRANQAKEEA